MRKRDEFSIMSWNPIPSAWKACAGGSLLEDTKLQNKEGCGV